MIEFDWMRITFVAVMGASLTMALRTGSLWPVFPNVRRAEAPVKFWLGVGFYGFFVVGFFVGLALIVFWGWR